MTSGVHAEKYAMTLRALTCRLFDLLDELGEFADIGRGLVEEIVYETLGLARTNSWKFREEFFETIE